MADNGRMIFSFPPIAAPGARLLILGSMPGRASLDAGQYYAHPRNAFWPVMAGVFGVDADAAYEDRCAELARHGVAVWDVLNACLRDGSLDSAIDDKSIVPNDFASFFDRYPRIAAVYFNGAKAEQVYRRHVLPSLGAEAAALPLTRLPSTSPAHASLSWPEKRAAWARAIGPAARGAGASGR
jgi:TDG/mug DNA glycosylase family protein